MNPLLLMFFGLVVLIALIHLLGRYATPVTPPDAIKAVAEGRAILIDVRNAYECQSGVADNAMILPLSDLIGTRELWNPVLAQYGKKLFLTYCASGKRSQLATAILRREGFKAENLGTYADLVKEGLPVKLPAWHEAPVGEPEI